MVEKNCYYNISINWITKSVPYAGMSAGFPKNVYPEKNVMFPVANDHIIIQQ